MQQHTEGLQQCDLCLRWVQKTSRHHLTPKQKGGKHGPTIDLCQPCHTTLHHTFTNAQLAKNFNSVEALRAAPELQEYLRWIESRTLERIPVRSRKR